MNRTASGRVSASELLELQTAAATGEVVNGTEGIDNLYGTTGNDTIYGLGGDDRLTGSTGNDVDPDGNDVIRAGDGNDVLWGGKRSDRLFGQNGDDQLDGGLGSDTLNGGAGFDMATYDGYYAKTAITFDASAIVDPAVAQGIADGYGGTDVLLGIEALRVRGSNFRDYLAGGSGNDTLDGESGRDTLIGGAGDDLLEGEEGNDIVRGGEGYDRAEFVLDEVTYFNASTVGTAAHITLKDGEGGTDELFGIEAVNVWGSWSGDDKLRGSGGHDLLVGRFGNDTLRGMDGNDTLSGWDDDVGDVLFGGTGADTLSGHMMTGGVGADRFHFSPWIAFTVTDFVSGTDRLELDDYDFEAIGPVGRLDPARFKLGTSIDSAGDRLVYNQASGSLWYDGDGTGSDYVARVVAQLGASTALSADDIWVV